jgi:hypothetical protein
MAPAAVYLTFPLTFTSTRDRSRYPDRAVLLAECPLSNPKTSSRPYATRQRLSTTSD